MGRHALSVGWRSLRLFAADQGLSWAGAIGLYIFLSVPPFIVASVSLAGLVVPAEDAERFVLEQIGKYLPAQQRLLEGIISGRPEGLSGGVVTVALLLFSGTRAFAAMASAVNVMWRHVDSVTFWRRQTLRLTLAALAVVLLALAALFEAVTGSVDASGSEGEIWLLEWQVLPIGLLMLFLLVAYKLLPMEHVAWRHAAVGAVLATLGVRMAQAATGIAAEAGALETAYGDLAGVALLATWALVVGIIVLVGAAIVAVLEGQDRAGDDSEARFHPR